MMQFGLATCDIMFPLPNRHGHRVLLDAADIINFANDGRTKALLRCIGSWLGIEPDQIMLKASHTHPPAEDFEASIAAAPEAHA